MSADVLLKMIIILSELRIAKLGSKNERTLCFISLLAWTRNSPTESFFIAKRSLYRTRRRDLLGNMLDDCEPCSKQLIAIAA